MQDCVLRSRNQKLVQMPVAANIGKPDSDLTFDLRPESLVEPDAARLLLCLQRNIPASLEAKLGFGEQRNRKPA